ncbi:cytidine deaminase family protein [Lacticaseibacillus kribbianus]|uniref:cytidine deaminase family protein n=1 Tax=Lacticaseibacillus kribbianus TaxID=2926292 RepID=UPI001CD5AAD9|nr:cytidine deaminase [Lacticaseibacillus kribbianus]
MDEQWQRLYSAAKAVLAPRNVSDYIEAGGVAAAIAVPSGAIYVGVCVDTACTLGVCAERNAIFNALTHGENRITRVLAIGADGQAMAPCGACRELMAQLMPGAAKDVQVMMDCQSGRVVTLAQLTPEWWV